MLGFERILFLRGSRRLGKILSSDFGIPSVKRGLFPHIKYYEPFLNNIGNFR